MRIYKSPAIDFRKKHEPQMTPMTRMKYLTGKGVSQHHRSRCTAWLAANGLIRAIRVIRG